MDREDRPAKGILEKVLFEYGIYASSSSSDRLFHPTPHRAAVTAPPTCVAVKITNHLKLYQDSKGRSPLAAGGISPHQQPYRTKQTGRPTFR